MSRIPHHAAAARGAPSHATDAAERGGIDRNPAIADIAPRHRGGIERGVEGPAVTGGI
jgi:hypothetical protein